MVIVVIVCLFAPSFVCFIVTVLFVFLFGAHIYIHIVFKFVGVHMIRTLALLFVCLVVFIVIVAALIVFCL